jgi:hypothetical protein
MIEGRRARSYLPHLLPQSTVALSALISNNDLRSGPKPLRPVKPHDLSLGDSEEFALLGGRYSQKLHALTIFGFLVLSLLPPR